MPSNPNFTKGSGDALAAQTRYYLGGFIKWLADNGQQGKGLVGEVGWPGSSNPGTDPIPGSGTGAKYDPRWDKVAQQWYIDANDANLHVTNWVASEWNIDLRVYRTDDGNNKAFTHRTTVSSVTEANPSSGTYLRGVNLAGAEFSDRGPSGSLHLSTTVQPGAGYYYPVNTSWEVLKQRGNDLIRFPIRWERFQRTLKGPLYEEEMAYMDAILKRANDVGCKVIIDMHNYGRYDTKPDGLNAWGVLDLGQQAPATHNGVTVGGTMMECFVDFWRRIALRYKDNPALWGYGLCNEPYGLTGNVQTWQESSRRATEAIRLIDQQKYVIVGGYTYSTIPAWTEQNGPTAWLTEIIPAGQLGAGQPRNTDPKIVWEGHHYWDPAQNGFDGGYQNTYDDELNYAQNQGFTAYTTAGYVAPATGNTTQTGERLMFTSSMDAAEEWNQVTTGSNGVNIPHSALGNPGNSLRILSTVTSDEGGVRKSLTAEQGKNIRTASFDFYIPTSATVSTTENFAIFHAWDNKYEKDLVELRIIGNGTSYRAGITIPTGSYATTMSTVNLAKGAWNTLKIQVTNTAFNLFINGATTASATVPATNTGINMGGIALGKFYGTATPSTMYFDNFIGSVTATYDAPPNGGDLGTVQPVVPPTPTDPGGAGIPINAWYANGVKPANLTVSQLQTIARARYDKWMTYTLTQDGMPAGLNGANAYRIKVPDQTIGGLNGPNGTVSEGIGYGMLINAWMSNPNLPAGIRVAEAKARFDGLWKYANFYKNGRGLMNWQINSDGTLGTSVNGASDGDFDIAMALILMHRIHGSTGAIDYGAEATKYIKNIRDYEFLPEGGANANIMLNGDGWDKNLDRYMPDYFRPGFFREYYNHTKDDRWLRIIAANYPIAQGYFYNNFPTGLVPDGSKRNGTENGVESYKYSYNSIRNGYSIILDFLWNGSNTNALAYNAMKKMATYEKTRTNGDASLIRAEYTLDGTSRAAYGNDAFRQAFGAASLADATTSDFAAAIINNLAADTADSYFGGGLAAVSSIVMAGIAQNGTSTTPEIPKVNTKGLLGFF